MAVGYGRVGTNQFACAKFIVDINGIDKGATHATIAAALNDAQSGDTIFIKPGTYNEDLTLISGVNLCAFACDSYHGQVTIQGKLTATFTGSVAISGIYIITDADNFLVSTGSNTSDIHWTNCSLVANNATGMSINNANFEMRFENCVLETNSNNLLFAITSISGIDFRNSTVSSGTGVNTIAAGSVNFFNCRIQDFTITSSGSGFVNCYNSFWSNATINTVCATIGGSGASEFRNSQFFSGTASAFSVSAASVIEIFNASIESSNTNIVTGAGEYRYSSVAMTGSSNVVNATTQTTYYTDLGKFKARGQPSFLAYLGSSDTNATGNGAVYTLGGTTALTEVYDLATNFNTNGTFTAPVAGKYFLQFACRTTDSTGATSVDMQLVTTKRTYRVNINLSSLASHAWTISVLANMDAADTATYTISLSGIGANTASVVGGTPVDTYVSGQLIS